MRLFLIFIITAFVGVLPLQAQIKTYDIKYTPSSSDEPTSYSDLQQISPTRLLAIGGSGDLHPFLLAINRDGVVEQRWKANFKSTGTEFYHYNTQTNTIVYLTTELLSTTNPTNIQIRLVLLDSNLTEKSNVVLDSSVTGMATKFNKNLKFQGITMLDSTILWMSYRYSSVKGTEQIALRISGDGKILGRKSIIDTNRYITHYPLFQFPSGEILFNSSIYDVKNDKYLISLWTSDTAFHFAPKPIVDSLYNSAPTYSIPTSDKGIALTYYSGNRAIVIKYDKNFKKQWMTDVPGGNYNTFLKLIESTKGGYYIITNGQDTSTPSKYPEFKDYPFCFKDIVLSKINVSGKVLYSAYYGSELCNEEPYDMIQDYSDDGIITTGKYNRPLNNSVCESLCNDFNTFWLFKVDTLGEPAKRKVVTDVAEEIGITNAVRLFPNPTSGILTVEFDRADYFTSIEIVDINGIILQSLHLKPNHQHRANIDISAFPTGNYFCRLRSQSSSITRPFVVQK